MLLFFLFFYHVTRVINNFKRSSTKFINKVIEGVGQADLLISRKCAIRYVDYIREKSCEIHYYPPIRSLGDCPWNYINCIYENLWRTFEILVNTRNACRFRFLLLASILEIKFIYAPLQNINNQIAQVYAFMENLRNIQLICKKDIKKKKKNRKEST